MSLEILLVSLSTIITVWVTIPYIRNTLKGRTKPNRVSWSMWATAPLVGTVLALQSGADPWVTTRTFLGGFLPLMVFLFSFANRNSYWKLTTFDVLCGICSGVAIILWVVFGTALIGLLFAVLADSLATIPTITKAWKSPETETPIAYWGYLASTLVIMPLVPEWNFENSAFLIALALGNTLILLALYRKKLRLLSK